MRAVGWDPEMPISTAQRLHEWLNGYQVELVACRDAVLRLAAPLDDWLTAEPMTARDEHEAVQLAAERAALGETLTDLWAAVATMSEAVEKRLAAIRRTRVPKAEPGLDDVAPFSLWDQMLELNEEGTVDDADT